MARLGLAGSSGNSSGTTAIRVPRTFEEQIEEAHGVGDERLAQAMLPGANSPIAPLPAMVVASSREDVRDASKTPPVKTVAEEKAMRLMQGGINSVPQPYEHPLRNRGFNNGGILEEEEEYVYEPGKFLPGGRFKNFGLGEMGTSSLGWVKENPWEAAELAALGLMAVPVAGWGAGLGLRGALALGSRARPLLSRAGPWARRFIQNPRQTLGQSRLSRIKSKSKVDEVAGDSRSRHSPLERAGKEWWTRTGSQKGRVSPTGKFRTDEEMIRRLGNRGLLLGGGGAGLGLATIMGMEEGNREVTEGPATPPEVEEEDMIISGDGGVDNYALPARDFSEWDEYLDQISSGYNEGMSKSDRGLLLLQMASNLSQPGATPLKAFDGVADLGLRQKALRQRENAQKARESIALMRSTLERAGYEDRRSILPVEIASMLARTEVDQGTAAINRMNAQLAMQEAAAKFARRELGLDEFEQVDAKDKEAYDKYYDLAMESLLK